MSFFVDTLEKKVTPLEVTFCFMGENAYRAIFTFLNTLLPTFTK